MRSQPAPGAPLELTYAGVEYMDRTHALATGEVQPAGVHLSFRPFSHVGDLFRRMAQAQEFAVAEMSVSSFLLMLGRGDTRLVGLPVFPSRAFRHSQVYVHANSGITEPRHLIGRDVGVPEYQMTAAVWIRAFLQHDYGVEPGQMRWLTGGLVTPVYVERLHHESPPGVRIERIGDGKTLESMLEIGELPALVTARQPLAFLDGSPAIRRLFPDYRSVENAYFQRTRHFPMMHMVVLRRDVYEGHPWLALALLDAFEEAKRRGIEHLLDQDTLAVMHPWLAAELQAMADLFGGDPFAYGFDANLNSLQAIVRYSYEQGLSRREIDPQEMFASETLEWQAPSPPYCARQA